MARPYNLNSLEETQDLDRFLQIDPKTKTMVFTGKKLQLYIPERFSVYDLLEMGETVKTITIGDIVVDDKYHASMLMLAQVELAPSEITTVMVDAVQYVCLTFYTGDRFICNTELIMNGNIVYALYVEFISRGKMPYFMSYADMAILFDQAKPMCDTNLKVDHTILEILYSHIARDQDDYNIQYRYTDQVKDPHMIALRDISYGPTSTSSKLIGSYFQQALNSVLLDEPDTNHEMEDLLR